MEAYNFDRVMVVDDNSLDLFIAESTFRNLKYAREIQLASSGAEALELLQRSAAEPDSLPAVIFLDINMPEMNGFQFLDHFETLPESVHQHCRIYVLTSSMDPDDKKWAEGNRFVSGFLRKPIIVEELKGVR